MNDPHKTVIKFKFLKPCGFSLDGKGNFWPQMKMQLLSEFNKTAGKNPPPAGNTWIFDYDFSHEFQIELPNERVRPLPAHIEQHQDEAVRTAHKIRQAEAAADQFAKNNALRDELKSLERAGFVKVLYDSFVDEPVESPEEGAPEQVAAVEPIPAKKRGRPKKVAVNG